MLAGLDTEVRYGKCDQYPICRVEAGPTMRNRDMPMQYPVECMVPQRSKTAPS